MMRMSREPQFRISSAPLLKSEIAVVLELFEDNTKMKHPFFKKLKKKKNALFPKTCLFRFWKKGRSGLNSIDERGVRV